MDRTTSDIINICRELGSEKGPERRKAALKLKNSLAQSQVKKALDRNFESKQKNGGKMFTWENIFKGVCIYVSMETEELKHANENVSRATLTNRETRKQDVSALVKCVIRVADKGGPKMKGSSLFCHILEILKDPYMRGAYGQDYCSILLKNVLSTRKYVVELSRSEWHDMVFLFCKLFNDPDVKIDKLVIARIIHSLICGITVQCDLKPKKILSFFTDFFSRAKQYKSSLLLEHMLKAVNVFVAAVGPTSRVQVCKLGEDITKDMLYLWKNLASDQLKDCLVEFLQTQVSCHHPRGERQGSVAAFALDWDVWMSLLRKLYEILYTEFLEIGAKTRSKDCVMKASYIQLAADVCQQLFSESSHCIEVTQMTLTGGGDTQSGPGAKKRRLESGWESLRNHMSQAGQTVKLIPWLQLVTHLVERYPDTVPRGEVLPYLTCLSHILADCKRSDLLTYILCCLQAFASSWGRLIQTDSSTDQARSTWNQIWMVTLRSVSLHNAEGFHLLSAIVKAGLMTPGKDMWSVFQPSVTQPNGAAAKFLYTHLSACDIPEKYVPSLMVPLPGSLTDLGFPLRKQLFDWLLPSKDNGGEGQRLVCNMDPDWTAQTLVTLTLKDPSLAVKNVCEKKCMDLCMMERIYLETCMELPLRIEEAVKDPEKAEPGEALHVGALLQELEALIQRDVQYYCALADTQLSDVEEMVTYANMVVCVISRLLELRVLEPTQLAAGGLVDNLAAIMKKLTQALVGGVKKEGVSSMMSVLVCLRRMLTLDVGTSDNMCVVAQVCRAVTPSGLMELLLDVCLDRNRVLPGTQPTDSVPTQSRYGRGASGGGGRARVLEEFDDFDIEFDDQPNNNNVVEDIDMEAEDSQEADDNNAGLEVFHSVLEPAVLNESQQLRLEAVHLLCHWCSFSFPSKTSVNLHADVEVKYVKSKLLGLISESTFDPCRLLDLQILKLVVNQLMSDNNHVTYKDIDTVLTAIRLVSKTHRKDQEICATSLQLLTQLVSHLSEHDTLPTGPLQQCRESAVHLINVFWKLQEDAEYSSLVRRSLASVMEKLIECDPESKWTRFPGEGESDSENDADWPTPADRFIYCCSDYCHMVRISVAQNLYKLFQDGQNTRWPRLQDSATQRRLYDQISTAVVESVDVQGRMSAERQEDEWRNRVGGAVHALGTVVCVSPVCEKEAVFCLLHIMVEKHIDTHIVQRTLAKVSSYLGYKTPCQFMESHLPFLVHRWIKQGLTLEKFPYQTFNCATLEDFFRQYHSVMIPQLVSLKNRDALVTIATALHQEMGELLKSNVPATVVHILPWFATTKLSKSSSDSENVRKQTHRAKACYDFLTAELSEEVVEQQIAANVDEIVVNLLLCVYDSDTDDGSIRDSSPEPNPPVYPSHTIETTLKYITSSFSGSGKTLVEILSRTTDGIQKILLALSVRLCACHRLPEKRRVLLMYQLFVRLLLKQFQTQLGGTWAFVLRDVITRLVHLLQDMTQKPNDGSLDSCYREGISSMTLILLREMVTVAMETCSEELVKYLPLLTSNLVATVVRAGKVGDQALSLLKYLILEKRGTMKDAIATLDNFPDLPVFKDCREVHQKLKYFAGQFTFKQEVQHFLRVCYLENVDPALRLEGLKFLTGQLSTGQDLSPLTSDGTLCQLVCELIKMTRCNREPVVLEAGKCLGLIGPVNLRTLSLPTQRHNAGLEQALQAFKESPNVIKYCKIFHSLNEYLTNKDMSLVQCVSDTLKNLLSVKAGSDFSVGYTATLKDTEFLFTYLHPFRPSKKKGRQVESPARRWETFQSTVDQQALWNTRHSNHNNWIITLTTTLINSGAVRDEILLLLAPVCSMKVEFCELILPYLVHDILLTGDTDHQEVMSRQVDNFFRCHSGQVISGRMSRSQSLTSPSILTDDDYACMNVDTVRTMLGIVQYLRQQQRPKHGRKEMTAWDNNFWLDIDYFQVAMASQFCSAHFSTVLFAEIWCDLQREESRAGRSARNSQGSQGRSQNLSQDTRIDTLSEASSTASRVTVQDLLLEAYRCIGEPDGLYGCGAGRKPDHSSRLSTYEQQNEWDKAVIACDVQMVQSGAANQYNVLLALHNLGASHVLQTYLQGMMGSADTPSLPPDTKELQYEATWRMGQWDVDTSNKLSPTSGIQECLYKALRAVHEGQKSLADSALRIARLVGVSRCTDGCVDSCRTLYPALANLQCVSILETLTQADVRGTYVSSLHIPDVGEERDTDFEFILPTLYMKTSALRVLRENFPRIQHVYESHVQSLRQLARAARLAGRHQISERAISELGQLELSELSLQVPCKMEEAQMFWARGEQNVAKRLVRIVIDDLNKFRNENPVAAQYYPKALSMYGNWLAETRSENPNIIMENYLEKSVGLFEDLGGGGDTSLDAYLALARYADSQYQSIVNYMKSSTFEAKQSLMQNAQLEAEKLREAIGDAKDRYLLTLEKQSRIDKLEHERMLEDRHTFLVKAVQNYIKCLRAGDAHNLRVFRLMSLWFSNNDVEEVNNLMQEGVGEIGTYKWLPLMYQLAARMDVKAHSETGQNFLDTLNKMIYQTAVVHPHHTVFCIQALANANRDTELLQQGRNKQRSGRLSRSQADQPPVEGRVQAAKAMIERLRQDGTVGGTVQDIEALCDAYIQLANWGVGQYKTETKPIQLPAALWISKVKDLKNVPVPTRSIQVDPSGSYTNLAYLHKFEPTFKLAGGINLPKIIACIGSDGSRSRQLVKGRDDLRQDAVMQQVFDMVNQLLQNNAETRKRHLQIRKYKVIPLSQRSGLLEWCEGTQPLGEYLIGSAAAGVKGAHARYNPQDWSAHDCRKHLTAGRTVEEKLKAYREVCDKFQPVLRHFFMEKFPTPALWFERRLAYSRSVATNSIVGYILGLGDRHVQNILIDCHTAELVHIDLGVAFEQGKILPTPETVPFRLTRDLEDAMGATGVEGVFRRCCEKTMEVMRNHQEALLTILEVLLYDPLHAWTISPAKAYALQQRRGETDTVDLGNTTTDIMDLAESSGSRSTGESQENVNKLAERVLLRLQQKLQGVEDGVQLSLSGQVNHLIQEARNPSNLSRLFPGWQPYI